jgi:hypothetical protein
LYPTGRERDALYNVDGQWTEAFTIKDAKHKKEVEAYNAKSNKTTPLTIADISKQDPMESRRAWEAVAVAIQKGDMDAVSVEKGKIEMEQRTMRKQEQSDSRIWVRRHFSCSEDDKVFKNLGWKIDENAEPGKTGGIWRWDPAKAEKIEGPRAQPAQAPK